ncbi:helix-turn-helix domain-containing protein [Pseudonocardia sp. H11422]|uniref:helix-turn-helix domain-containing protein n=1 Tax=Pseudonocardia sp. H11422 TaxID=2835866 RepID=UPI001BDD3D17|nr:helix-turn-helix domain-containing protein [Pseudonocardia sp. H11422]
MTAASNWPHVTVGDLLRLEELQGVEPVAGHQGLDSPVTGVAVVQRLGRGPRLVPGTLVVGAFSPTAGYEIDILLRHAHTNRAAGVLVAGEPGILSSTRRIADRLRLPLLTVPSEDPLHLAWCLLQHVHEPERLGARIIRRVVDRLGAPVTSAEHVVSVLETELRAPVTLMGPDGTTVVGARQDAGTDPALAAALEHPIAQVLVGDSAQRVLAPVVVAEPGRAELWLLAEVPAAPDEWLVAVKQVLRTAGWAISSWVMRERLSGEKDARDRTTLLADLVDGSHVLSRRTAERALRLGWRLDGWHTSVHLRIVGDGGTAPGWTPQVARAFREQRLQGELVEWADGWAWWTTDDREPASTAYRELTEAVRRVLASLAEQLQLAAGIGRPYAGASGIVGSLAEARDAALFAGTTSRRDPVEHVDELGLRRVLADWYLSEAFGTYARNLLEPLLSGREGTDLLETLHVYLDRESSASSTAAHLGVHRNTVTQRIARAEQLLSVNLARPDDRLVVQLACRVLRQNGLPDRA